MILEKVQDIFRDVLDNEELIINEETTRNDIEEWDSLENINIVIAIEEEFNIKIALDEVEEFKEIGSIINIISKKLKNN